MPWSGVVYCGDNSDEDNIERICSHEHKTQREARRCGDAMATERDMEKGGAAE